MILKLQILSIFILSIFIAFCQSGERRTLPPNNDTIIRYNTAAECLIFTYYNNDSASKEMTKSIRYNSDGLETEIITQGFMGSVNGKSIKLYDSNKRLVEFYNESKIVPKGEISKTIYNYDKQGNLINQKTFTFKRRIKKNVDKGYGRPGGCIITEEDYEKEKTWALETEWNFYYDNQNRLIKKFAPTIVSSQDLYEFKYAANSTKPIEENSYNSLTGLIYSEKYSIKKDTIIYVRHWYSEDGSRRKDINGNLTQNYIWFEIYNKKGNIIEKYVFDKDEKKYFNRHVYLYDPKNRLIKENSIDENGKITWTALYEYKETANKDNSGSFEITQK